ncbi:hypothetical protein CCR91_15670 [Thiorhodovibrio winogradskyi]|nr:hypothetical protein [Thiorhodovibrio winogradskyi]
MHVVLFSLLRDWHGAEVPAPLPTQRELQILQYILPEPVPSVVAAARVAKDPVPARASALAARAPARAPMSDVVSSVLASGDAVKPVELARPAQPAPRESETPVDADPATPRLDQILRDTRAVLRELAAKEARMRQGGHVSFHSETALPREPTRREAAVQARFAEHEKNDSRPEILSRDSAGSMELIAGQCWWVPLEAGFGQAHTQPIMIDPDCTEAKHQRLDLSSRTAGHESLQRQLGRRMAED